GPAAGDAGQRPADPVGVLDQPDTGPEQLAHDVTAVLDAQAPLRRGEADPAGDLHQPFAVVEQQHDHVGPDAPGRLGGGDLRQVALVELEWLAAEGLGDALD